MLLSNKALELITSKYEDNHKDRLVHTLGVAEMAEYLAKRYGVDRYMFNNLMRYLNGAIKRAQGYNEVININI